MNTRPCALVVDDDALMRDMVACLLDRLGFETRTALDADEALFAVQSRPFAAIVCDLHMPRRDGFALARAVRRMRPETPLVLTTSFGAPSTPREAESAGAGAYLPKPFSSADLREAIARAARVAEARLSASN